MQESKIEYLRKKQKMSQGELADRLNISRQAVSEWERGISLPSVEKLITLSEIFDVSLDYLIKGKESSNERNESMDKTNLDYLHFANMKNTLGYVMGEKNGLIASIPKKEYVGNTLVVGGARTGKTTNYIIPNILKSLERGESVIVIDHSKEIYENIKDKISQYGFNLQVIDFTNPFDSIKFDLCSEVYANSKTPVLSDKYLRLIYKTVLAKHQDDPIVFNLLKMIIEARKQTTQSISELIDEFMNCSSEEVKKKISSLPLDWPTKQMLKLMPDKSITQIQLKIKGIICELFPSKEFLNMFFDGDAKTKDIVSPKTITIIVPDFFNENSIRLLGMLLDLTFMKITLKDIKIEERVNMFLDEYGNISEHFNLINNLSYLDKNIAISIIVQSVGQLKTSKDIVLNNFKNFLYLGSFNTNDIAVFSEFFEISENEIRHLNLDKLIFKRDYFDACILNKVNINS